MKLPIIFTLNDNKHDQEDKCIFIDTKLLILLPIFILISLKPFCILFV
jgi:hypothetical protein